MNMPNSDLVLVRSARDSLPGKDGVKLTVQIVRNNGCFDFSGYSFLRMRDDGIEEWVPTAELDSYKNAFGC